MGAGSSTPAQTVTRPVVWLPEATSDYYDALHWYANISRSLSDRLAEAVDEAVQAIAASPMRFPVLSNDRRRAGVRRFPYGLIYIVEASRIVVIACFHGRRDPDVWQRR